MNYPDLINAGFQLLGGYAVFLHCRRLWGDKLVRGVSIPATCFFTVWGLWNLVYFWALDQWWSVLGSMSITSMNLIYFGMMIVFWRREN